MIGVASIILFKLYKGGNSSNPLVPAMWVLNRCYKALKWESYIVIIKWAKLINFFILSCWYFF